MPEVPGAECEEGREVSRLDVGFGVALRSRCVSVPLHAGLWQHWPTIISLVMLCSCAMHQ